MHGNAQSEWRWLGRDFTWGMVPPTLLDVEGYTNMQRNGMVYENEDVLKSD